MYHLKIALRNLRRNALYSWINIIGLAVSLTACILILLWVQDELSYDRFHKRADDIYLLYNHTVFDGIESYAQSTEAPRARAAQEKIAAVEAACAVYEDFDLGYLEHNKNKFFDGECLLADTSLFRIFDATFIEGSPQRAFIDPQSVVITDILAQKLFGNEPSRKMAGSHACYNPFINSSYIAPTARQKG